MGTLPPIFTELTLRPKLMRRVIAGDGPANQPGKGGGRPATKATGGDADNGVDADGGERGGEHGGEHGDERGGCRTEKPTKLKPLEPLLVSVGAASCAGKVRAIDPDGRVHVTLDRPVCAGFDDVVAIS